MIVPIASERSLPGPAIPSATRAAPPTWAGSTTAGSASTTASPTSPPRSASPSWSGSTRCWPVAHGSPRSTSRASPASRACALRPSAERGEERRSWFVYVVRLPDDADRDATIAHLAEEGIASKAYLPCIHLFPHLRELGYSEGQFPVAEAAAAHSLALPFFPTMSESQVERVCEALARSLR